MRELLRSLTLSVSVCFLRFEDEIEQFLVEILFELLPDLTAGFPPELHFGFRRPIGLHAQFLRVRAGSVAAFLIQLVRINFRLFRGFQNDLLDIRSKLREAFRDITAKGDVVMSNKLIRQF